MSHRLEEDRRVVPFAAPPGRVRRRLIDDNDGRGAILLFTGVRYQRVGGVEADGYPHGPKSPDPRLRS